MRAIRRSASGLVRILAACVLLTVTGCVASEASPTSQAQNEQPLKLIHGYNCTEAAIAGRYSCARSRDRHAQRSAAAHAPPSCPSCGIAP